MERISEVEPISCFSPPSGEQLADYEYLLAGFGGLEAIAARAWEELQADIGSEIGPELAAILPAWIACPQTEALPVTTSRKALGAYGNRFAGMRCIWVAGDPEVDRFKRDLLRNQPQPPSDAAVQQLRRLGDLERIGNIVLLDGVPVPAGREQIAFFVTRRWRCLAIPSELPSASGEVKMADESLDLLLAYSTSAHRENLVRLQDIHVELFHAIWIKDLQRARKIASLDGKNKLKKCLLPADPRLRRLKDPVLRLLYGTAVLSEFERLFEICECLHRNRAVTSEAIKHLLKISSSMESVLADRSAVGSYVCGAIAQTRFSHPGMNVASFKRSDDVRYKQLHSALISTRGYWLQDRCIRRPFAGRPALYFIGIEQQFIPLAAIIMMITNMKALDGNFLHRAERGFGANRRTENEAVRLAAIIASNIDIRWARALLGDRCVDLSDADWVRMGMPATAHPSGRSDSCAHETIYRTASASG